MKIKLNEGVACPKKSHLPDVGLDFFLPEDFEIEPFETKAVSLGVAVEIPEGFAGMIVPRSSISEKGIIIQTSVIDPDYQGEIHLIATNCGKEKVCFKKGQRVCSLVIYSVLNARIELVDSFADKTDRGAKGLGSTGE